MQDRKLSLDELEILAEYIRLTAEGDKDVTSHLLNLFITLHPKSEKEIKEIGYRS